MTAKTFKRWKASVPDKSTCFTGWTTLVELTDGNEIAVFAPTKKQLIDAIKRSYWMVEINSERFQQVAYFKQESLSAKQSFPVPKD